MIDDNWRPDKATMMDSMKRPLTQGLFLEVGYDSKAIYTFKDQDYEYNGKLYPSLKRLYLLAADPTEYEFANAYLVSWKHWLRCCDNKLVRKEIEEWRSELEIKLRSESIKGVIKKASMGNLQAQKWVADRKWAIRPAGRPSKEEIERNKAIESTISDEYADDLNRLRLVN